MKKRLAVSVVVLALSACGSSEPPAPSEDDVKSARDAAKALGVALKARLFDALSTQGPIAAIEACALDAPTITASVSDKAGFDVSRTALRVRNSRNAPDAWEREQLETFVAAAKAGADPALMETATIRHEGGQAVFRYMKPIVMEAPCAMCHGEQISPEVKARIDEIYPLDAATGFREGEIRGAFTISRRLGE